jgi:tetratricopeptide (TPR) repeat protein/transcriptional regulator with XRE-family HTH domain
VEADLPEVLGAALQRLRKDAGLTQAAIGRRLGLKVSSISDLEKGRWRRLPARINEYVDVYLASLQPSAEATEHRSQIKELVRTIRTIDGLDSSPSANSASAKARRSATRAVRSKGHHNTAEHDWSAPDGKPLGYRQAAAVVLPIVPDAVAARELVGRDSELGRLLLLLTPSPDPGDSTGGLSVVSAVAGLAGVGKTALAWQAARAAVGRGWFPGGAFFVDLNGYDADPRMQIWPERVFGSILRALGVSAEQIPTDVGERGSVYHQLLGSLAADDRAMLLVVDNASEVDQVTPLLPVTSEWPHRVLITSRDTLVLPRATHVDLGVLAPENSIKLLATAVAARHPGDRRIIADARAAAQLANYCGHLPLALRIVAALLAEDPSLTAEALAADLAAEGTRLDRLNFDKTQWVRTAFEMSYRRLDPADARVLRLLGLIPGLDVATDAAADLIEQPGPETREALNRLARAHLLEQHRPHRWRTHDLIRLYARDVALRERSTSREFSYAVERAAGYYASRLAAARQRISPQVNAEIDTVFPDAAAASRWVDDERANLVATIEVAAVRVKLGRETIRLALDLAPFLHRGRHVEEWSATAASAERVAHRPGHQDLMAAVIANVGAAKLLERDFEGAVGYLEQAIALFRERGDLTAAGAPLNTLGNAFRELRRLDPAVKAATEAADIFGRAGDQYQLARSLNTLGMALIEARQLNEAVTALRRAAEAYTGLHDMHGRAQALGNLGMVLRDLRQFDEALAAEQQVAEIFSALGDRFSQGRELNLIGSILQSIGRHRDALDAHRDAAALFSGIGERQSEAEALNMLGAALQGLGKIDEAIATHREAVVFFEAVNDRQGEGRTHNNPGMALCAAGQFDEAARVCRKAAELLHDLSDPIGEADALDNLATAYRGLAWHREAAEAGQRAFDIYRRAEDREGEGLALDGLGLAKSGMGEFDVAVGHHEKAAGVLQEIGETKAAGKALENLATALLQANKLDAGRDAAQRAVVAFALADSEEDAARVRALLTKFPHKGQIS